MMKRNDFILLLVIFCLTIQSSAQPLRYTQKTFAEVDSFTNVEYATAPRLSNPVALLADYNIHDGESTTENQPLLMDIFMPKNDTVQKRPAIIFLHGGAFLLGSRKNEDMVALCDSFARRGYLTAAINYRLGMGADVSRFWGIPVGVNVTKANARRAVFRAMQDSRAAVRFLKHEAENYGIDTSRIFMTGSSAGAIATLNNFYLGENEIPHVIAQNPDLGNIDAIGISGYEGSADAAISLWGAIENLEIIENKHAPLFLVHGTDDNIVPFKKGIPLEGNVPPNQMITFTMPETHGSFCIDTFLTNRDIHPKTWFVKNQKHEFYGVNTGQFVEDGPNHYWDSTIQKTSKFLFNLIKPKARFEYEIDNRTIAVFNQSGDGLAAKWDFDGIFSSDEWQPAFTFPDYGNYKVKLAVCNSLMACDTITHTVNISPTKAPLSIQENLKVYPTPASGYLKFSGLSLPYDVSVFSLNGQIQLSKFTVSENQLDVSRLENGIYILKIETRDGLVVEKFVKTD